MTAERSAATQYEKVARRMIEDRNRYAALQGFHPEHTIRQEAAALEWLLANQRTGRIIHGDAEGLPRQNTDRTQRDREASEP